MESKNGNPWKNPAVLVSLLAAIFVFAQVYILYSMNQMNYQMNEQFRQVSEQFKEIRSEFRLLRSEINSLTQNHIDHLARHNE
ncbi:MAG: hypothetical protein OXN17_19325 [Candidatus Poribacteria bacterium]|nr:hypothetical protein [Candidatus Poribacteria bacterium]MDE0504783.1 hypothetical protein [Candidatus Poribacteria bacterium]